MPDTLKELRALEREAEREWWRLQGTLLTIAELNVGRTGGVTGRFREMQERAREIDRRRIAIAVRIAALGTEDRHTS
jgi:hypothetical protein